MQICMTLYPNVRRGLGRNYTLIIVGKLMVCPYKISYISAANCPRVPNMKPNKCLDTALLQNDKIYE